MVRKGEFFMIGTTLKRILEEKKMTPVELSRLTDIPVQTIYSIMKRDNDKVGLHKLVEICDVLDVSIEEFYMDYINSKSAESMRVFSEHEKEVIRNLRNLTEQGQKKVLDYINDLKNTGKYTQSEDVQENNETEKEIPVMKAARSDNNKPRRIVRLTAEQLEILEKSPDQHDI